MKSFFSTLFSVCLCMTLLLSCNKNSNLSGCSSDCFYFESIDPNVVISMKSSSTDAKLQFSQDGVIWETFKIGETSVVLENAADKVYFKAVTKNNNISAHFTSSGRVLVGGNIMFLLDFNGLQNDLDESMNAEAFKGLFSYMQYLVDASNLYLPAKTLTPSCYDGMFSGCSSLTEAPVLPATSLAERCYACMFLGCSSLTEAPVLPATTMKSYCYSTMFSSCSALTEAPELPSTSLADRCYIAMFSGCVKLREAPYLPAERLREECYMSMFSGCTRLKSIDVGFTSWNPDDDVSSPTRCWVSDVASSGTFKCPSEANTSLRGKSYVPEGWEVEVK